MKTLLLTAAVLAAGVVSAQAADLIIEEPAVVAEPALSNFYAQVVGGVALAGVISYSSSGDYDAELGWALGGAVGIGLFEGLSAEVDVLHLERELTGLGGYFVATTSLMGNLKYTVDLNDTFSIYGGAGLGYIWNHERDEVIDAEYDGSGFGYQLIAGVGVDVAENITLIGEYRFQNTFDGADMDYGQNVDAPTNLLLVGAKIGF